MPKQSAGLLPYRRANGVVEVFLVHPGGPFWASKDTAGWSIAKGEFAEGEEPLAAALREFQEETGLTLEGHFQPLGSIRQSGGKTVHAWAIEADLDPATIVSNTFTMEWPPRSGKTAEFPEIDRAAWFTLETAAEKLHKGQAPLLEKFRDALGII